MILGDMMPSEGILLDTSFFIRLLKENDPLFETADNYYRYFLENNFSLFISTISIAEYCVNGEIDQLPLKNLIILPFNIDHAKTTGNFARILFEKRNKGELIVDQRLLIINDAKLFSQAQVDVRINYYCTSDSRSEKIFSAINETETIKFNFLDISTNQNHNQYFGKLDL